MGLKMPTRLDANFIRGLFVGIPVPIVLGGVHLGMLISVVFLFEENSLGNGV